MAHPVQTKAFLQPRPEAAMLFAPPTHLPCSTGTEPKFQGHHELIFPTSIEVTSG